MRHYRQNLNIYSNRFTFAQKYRTVMTSNKNVYVDILYLFSNNDWESLPNTFANNTCECTKKSRKKSDIFPRWPPTVTFWRLKIIAMVHLADATIAD